MSQLLKIEGGNLLSGNIKINGSKNSALALIPASLLCKNIVKLTNVPRISDIFDMLEILTLLNVKYEFIDTTLVIDSSNIKNTPLVNEKIKKIRASYYFMGVLLSLFKDVTIETPGGCKIGERPIDYHLQGFKKLGIKINHNDDIYKLNYEFLNNTTIVLPFPSVGTTINLLFAAVKSESITILDNISKEPEVMQVIDILSLAGAKIKLIDEKTLIIIGNEFSSKITYQVMQDRIEAGTYCILGALLGNKLTIENIGRKYLNSLFDIFSFVGVKYILLGDSITFYQTELKNYIDISTAPYPLFPTDLQQPLCVLASQLPQISYILEGIYYERKGHVHELQKMGMDIKVFNNKIIINGKSYLKGARIKATDLRGGASLVIASLIAKGTSYIEGVEYINRGYHNFIEKLTSVGAKIELEEII